MDRLPFYELLCNASPVVKAVLLLLVAASILSWAIAFEKAVRILAFSKHLSRLAGSAPRFDGRANWLGERLRMIADTEPKALGDTPSEFNARLERSLQIEAGEQIQRLQAGLPFLASVGATAPFVGLFGTVWGIMHSFNGIAAAKDTNLATVAPGIAEALFATAMGLAAAIPAVLFYNQANVSLSRIAARLSGAAARFAKERAYGFSSEANFGAGQPSLKAEQGLTNGELITPRQNT